MSGRKATRNTSARRTPKERLTVQFPPEVGQPIRDHCEGKDIGSAQLARMIMRFGINALKTGRAQLVDGEFVIIN